MRVWPVGDQVAHAPVAPGDVGRQHGVDVEVVPGSRSTQTTAARRRAGPPARYSRSSPVGTRISPSARRAVKVAASRALPFGVPRRCSRRRRRPRWRQGDVLDRALDARRERVGDVVEQQPDRRLCAPGEGAVSARAGVGPQAQLVDRRPDPVGERL